MLQRNTKNGYIIHYDTYKYKFQTISQTCILLHIKIGFPGPATSNIFVIHASFFRFHSITVHPSFECSEQNHHSDFVQFPSAVTEDCFKLYKEKKTSQDLYYKTI